MIPPRVKGLCFVSFKLSGQAAECGFSSASGCRVLALDVGPKKLPSRMTATTHHWKSRFFGVILLVPLITVFF
jgi:hypothetical protein